LKKIDIKEYYQRYGAMVYRRCLKLLGTHEKALDATHDTFLKLIDNQDKIKAQYPSALLFRIATNHSLNILKKESKMLNNYDDFDLSVEDQSCLYSKDIIYKLFKNEKLKTFTIAVHYFLDGMTLEELSTEVGMSVSGVRKILGKITLKAKAFKEE
jgi:RNA polymerase sigma-70 factor (ECF subfamily)